MGLFYFEIILNFETKSKVASKAFARIMESASADFDKGVFVRYGTPINKGSDASRWYSCLFKTENLYCVPEVKEIEELLIKVAQNAIRSSFTAEYNVREDEFITCASFKYSKQKLVTRFNCWTQRTDPDDPDEESTILVPKEGCGSHCRWYVCDGYRHGDHVVNIEAVKHEESFKKDGLLYDEFSDGLKLFECKSKEKTIIVPSEVEGMPVTCIGAYAFTSPNIDAVILPESVKKIEKGAFSGVSDIDIYFPETLTEIAESVILWGDSIRVHIPETVEFIEPYAFEDSKPIIYGKKGSFAQRYAKFRKLKFKKEP